MTTTVARPRIRLSPRVRISWLTGPGRQFERTLVRRTVVQRLAVRDDHVLERQVEQRAERREHARLVPRRPPDEELAGTLRQRVGEDERPLLGEPERRLVAPASVIERLETAGRLTRPKHWLEFAPYQMAHTPLKMTIPETQEELERAWAASYSPEANRRAVDSISDQGVNYRLIHLVMRLFFRGIYFPQMNKRAWLKVIFQNRRAIYKLAKEGVTTSLAARKSETATAAVMAHRQ